MVAPNLAYYYGRKEVRDINNIPLIQSIVDGLPLVGMPLIREPRFEEERFGGLPCIDFALEFRTQEPPDLLPVLIQGALEEAGYWAEINRKPENVQHIHVAHKNNHQKCVLITVVQAENKANVTSFPPR